jgi:hypothetical protein
MDACSLGQYVSGPANQGSRRADLLGCHRSSLRILRAPACVGSRVVDQPGRCCIVVTLQACQPRAPSIRFCAWFTLFAPATPGKLISPSCPSRRMRGYCRSTRAERFAQPKKTAICAKLGGKATKKRSLVLHPPR